MLTELLDSRFGELVRKPIALALVLVLALALVTATQYFAPAEVDARARTIHPCLLGDEPCPTPAPTTQPR